MIRHFTLIKNLSFTFLQVSQVRQSSTQTLPHLTESQLVSQQKFGLKPLPVPFMTTAAAVRLHQNETIIPPKKLRIELSLGREAAKAGT